MTYNGSNVADLTKHPVLCLVWLGDEGMEIKRQITGMMRLLSDKAGRVYQRVGAERDSLQKEPPDEHLSWAHQPATLSVALEDQQTNSWSPAGDPGPSPSSISTPVLNGPGCSQYSTRSKALRILNNTKDLIKVNEANGRAAQHTWEGKNQQTQVQFLKEQKFLMIIKPWKRDRVQHLTSVLL